MNKNIIIGVLIPFLGTSLGAAMVYLMKNELSNKVQKSLAGFAAGVMVAASIWSLIIPGMDMVENQMGRMAWIPAVIGFAVGIAFLLFLDNVIPHQHVDSNVPEGPKSSSMRKTTMMVLAVIIHNIPEGMAVGVSFAGVLAGETNLAMASAIVLSIGIAIQNFPEGAIISMPLKSQGIGKHKAFGMGVFSGAVEPMAAIITILLSQIMIPILPYLLSFAAGAMLYVVVEELIPEATGEGKDHTNLGTIWFSVGFSVMMILDVMLG
ncbi:ZIP family metal transporter [Anaerococcus sp. AGMB00486]|uniref:ZIP family metal transporter n=1 Tax=Anaerococcus faecalis TaxID=2742993 RepID=A0ABX2NBG1_9FIRM|nr:ZIP family metal transporter [Anaerococcus faecalis]NVF12034.1 ZIP family metal transporter [Anaerococcus faecalis]